MDNGEKLELLGFLGKPVPEWQRQFIESYEKLAKKSKADEEVRLVNHPRGHYRMWAIVKKGQESRLSKPHPFMTDAGVDEVNALLDKADELDEREING